MTQVHARSFGCSGFIAGFSPSPNCWPVVPSVRIFPPVETTDRKAGAGKRAVKCESLEPRRLLTGYSMAVPLRPRFDHGDDGPVASCPGLAGRPVWRHDPGRGAVRRNAVRTARRSARCQSRRDVRRCPRAVLLRRARRRSGGESVRHDPRRRDVRGRIHFRTAGRRCRSGLRHVPVPIDSRHLSVSRADALPNGWGCRGSAAVRRDPKRRFEFRRNDLLRHRWFEPAG